MNTQDVLTHMQNFLQMTELNTAYETSRMRARDYIVEVLTSSTGKSIEFS